MSRDTRAVQKLRREVAKTKRALSSTHQGRVEIEAFFDGVGFTETLRRARVEEININLFRGTLGPVKQVLEDSGLKKNQIDEIVRVGGSTRIPDTSLGVFRHLHHQCDDTIYWHYRCVR